MYLWKVEYDSTTLYVLVTEQMFAHAATHKIGQNSWHKQGDTKNHTLTLFLDYVKVTSVVLPVVPKPAPYLFHYESNLGF